MKKFSKFNIVFEKVMKSLITEAWDRFDMYTITDVTRIVTHDFKDDWQKGVTGKIIVSNLMKFSHMKGAVRVDGNGEKPDPGYDWTFTEFEDYWKLDKILNQALHYWQVRKQNGDDFSMKNYAILYNYFVSKTADYSAVNRGKSSFEAVEVGKVAYAIWKAAHAGVLKSEQNLKEMESMDIDSMFKKGSKMTVKLNVTGKFSKQSEYGQAVHIQGTSDEYPGLKFDIVGGKKLMSARLSDFPGCPKERFTNVLELYYDPDKDLEPGLVSGDIVTFSAKVKYVIKERKTVYLNFADIVSFDHFVDLAAEKKAAQDAVPTILKKMESMSEEERNEVRRFAGLAVTLLKDAVNRGDSDMVKKSLEGLIDFGNKEKDFSKTQTGEKMTFAPIAYDFKDIDFNSPTFIDDVKKVLNNLYNAGIA